MTAYIDSSVLLRKLLKQEKDLPSMDQWRDAITSTLTIVECRRSIDRSRILHLLNGEEMATSLGGLREMVASLQRVDLTENVLEKASESYPTTLGALDAIHLATALLWREGANRELIFLTHDRQQGIAAKALGFRVEGI